LKMVIKSISPKQQNGKNQWLIYYSIITTDFNQDGKLHYGDPEYLFISELSGQGFRQISPDNFDLAYWKIIQGGNKILIQARNCNNGKNDEIVAFIYDIERQELEPVFDQEFILKTKKLLENQWTKKK
jgi:hypothetical protein